MDMSSTVALEMLTRVGAGLRASWWLAIPCVSLALLLTATRVMSAHAARVLRGVLLTAGVGGAMAWAWHLRWLCDDADASPTCECPEDDAPLRCKFVQSSMDRAFRGVQQLRQRALCGDDLPHLRNR